MNKRILLLGILCLVAAGHNAQTVYLTEDENNIYWQPGIQINFSDYQGPKDEACLRNSEKYGVTMCSSIGVRGVVDAPKKKKKYDKFYVAPVFCKNCSCLLAEDSLNLKVDRLLLDVAEFYARNMRRELLGLHKEMNTDNTYAMFFNTVKKRWDEEMQTVLGTVIREVLIEKKDSAYLSWRQTITEVLQKMEDYATKPEDCHRFVAGKPIEKGYEKADRIVGDMRKKEE